MREELELCPGCFQEDWSGGPCSRCGFRIDPDAFPTALHPGTRVSKYLVGRILGKPGGFGITYLAFDTVLRRRLALKELMPRELVARRPDGETLHVQTRQDEKLFKYTLTSFLNEARLIAQFSHPNLVRVMDFFEANGTAYFAMEYYEGQTLAEYVQQAGGRIPGDEAVGLILPLVEALDHIHSLEEPVLHRDIKPANVYLTGKRTPILLDFGAARVALGQQSRSLSAVLTPGFAPYEQYSTRGNQGPWTDVYGCAATLYFLVTGRAPPEASLRVEDPAVEPPSRIGKDVSPALSDAIVRGLGFKPSDRPQSAREFADLLTGKRSAEAATRLHQPEPARSGEAATRPAPAGPEWDRDTEPAPSGAEEGHATTPAPSEWDGGETEAVPAEAAAGAAPTPGGGAPPHLRGGSRKGLFVMLGLILVLGLATAGYGLSLLRGGGDGEGLRLADGFDAHAAEDGAASDPPPPGIDARAEEGDGAGAPSRDAPPGDRAPGDAAGREAGGAAEREAARPAPQGPPPAREAAAGAGAETPAVREEAPTPAPAPAEVASGVLVIVYGDDPAGTQQAETAVLRSLVGRQGLEPLDQSSLSMIRGDQAAVDAANRGDFGALAELGRRHGAEFLVVGTLSSRAVPSVGRFFTGTAEMDLKMYRVSTGALVDANTFRVGSGGAQGILATTEGEARSRAAAEVGSAAAEGARQWLARAFR